MLSPITSSKILKYVDPLMIRLYDRVQSLALKDDILVVSRLLSGISVIDVSSESLVKHIPAEEMTCLTMASSPSSLMIALEDSTIKVINWNSIKSDQSSTINAKQFITSMEARSDDSVYVAVNSGIEHTIDQYDLRTGECTSKLLAHSDIINRIRSIPNEPFMVMSVGEDGLCGMWDTRTGQLEASIVPNEMSEVTRYAKWLSCLDISYDGKFFVVGGGPQMAIFDVRGLIKGPVSVFKGDAKFCPYVGHFTDSEIVAGGASGEYGLYRMGMDGNLIGRGTKCSMLVVTDIVMDTQTKMTMCVGGLSPTVDVFNNLAYMSHSFKL
ncbi:hypothetical protein ACOME3_001631 [Neoechinorhynchus agilis]